MQWSSPDMVDEVYDIYIYIYIYIYIPNLHGNHTLCYLGNDCTILKQKNPSEGSDVSSSKKREQQIRQQPQC